MAGLFGGGGSPKMPAVPPPAPIPQQGGDQSDLAMMEAKKRAGFQKTLITGDLQPQDTGKRQLLGG